MVVDAWVIAREGNIFRKTGNGWLWKYEIKNDFTAGKNGTETKQHETIRNHRIKIVKEIRQKEKLRKIRRTGK